MEDSTTQPEANSGSASERSASHPELKTRGSGSSMSSKSARSQDESTTPAGTPQHGGQQSSAMPGMAPPPKPNFKATPSSAQPSQPISSVDLELPTTSTETIRNSSRQPAAPFKSATKDTVHATPRKRSHTEVDQQQTTDDEEEATDEDNEPANSIAAFDWMDLESRYHQQMNHYHAQEQDLYKSFSELCEYFYIWAETGHAHEVGRSFKRMKTQITLVQHNEEVLESKRQHYVKVVDAFKTVARMLNDGEKAASAKSTLGNCADLAKTILSHATIVDAYNWDGVHSSRCVIL